MANLTMRIVGIVLAAGGLAILGFYSAISSMSFIQTLSIKPAFVMIAGLALAILGAVFLFQKSGSSSKQVEKEVPIYKGKEIVGYRMSK